MNVTYIFMDFQSLCGIFDLLYFCGNFKKLYPNHFGGVIKPHPQKYVKAHKMLQVLLILVPLLS